MLSPANTPRLRGPFSVERTLQQAPHAGVLHWARIVIWILGCQPRGAIQTIGRHTDVLQRKRASDARRQVIYTLGGVLDAKRFGRDPHCFRDGFTIECDRMRQYNGVCLSMRQIERSTQRVTKLVMRSEERRVGKE